MTQLPKYILFVVNPIRQEVVLVNHRRAALGSNQWNGILCPMASTGMFDPGLDTMIVFEIFALTESIYASKDWSAAGDVSYNHGDVNCQILLSLTSDISFAKCAGGLDSRLMVANQDKINELDQANLLAPYVKLIVENIFSNLKAIGAISSLECE